MNLKAPNARPEGYSIDCKVPISLLLIILPSVICLVKLGRPAAQFYNRYQPGP
jgi:hypothetical protein